MPRRRLDPRAAADELSRALKAQGTVEGVVFPPMSLSQLHGVQFIDCDVGAISLGGSRLRRGSVSDCRFEACGGPTHALFDRVDVEGCEWVDTQLEGVIRRSAMVGCTFTRVRFRDVDIQDSRLTRCQIREADLDGVMIRSSSLEDVTVSGRADHFLVQGVTLRQVDFSDLHITDGALDGLEVGSVRFPVYHDSFVVPGPHLETVREGLRDLVRPEAIGSLEHALGAPMEADYQVFDGRRLDMLYGDGPRLLPEEQARVLERLRTLMVASAGRIA